MASLGQTRAFVSEILGHMCSALSDGEDVTIMNFGAFLLREKGARVGRNPRTGELHPISARRVLAFRPSGYMREQVAAPMG